MPVHDWTRVDAGLFHAFHQGWRLPDMPLFLEPEVHVPAPLEATYQTTWKSFPAALKGLVETSPAEPPNNQFNA
jgi:hypothetical protein